MVEEKKEAMSDIEKKRNMLLHYKREDIRILMAKGATDREVSARFDFGFGKRPDTVSYPNDILELVKKGATSFHFSEERWNNPMQLNPSMRKQEQDDLRIGWDLVLDIDCPVWEFAKLIAQLFVKALENNGVKKSVSIKFSGNKGFHIGVPYEAFPKTIDGIPTNKLFPQAPRIISEYLLDYIDNQLVEVKDNIISFDKKKYNINEIKEKLGKSIEELTKQYCPKCKKEIIKKAEKQIFDYLCEKCGTNHSTDTYAEFKKCEKCGFLIHGKERTKKFNCESCKINEKPMIKFNTRSVVEVDTVLISSRHLYRCEYSMHEKSGLVSIPFNPEKVEIFEKHHAKVEAIKITKYIFLDRENALPNEAGKLFEKAYHHHHGKEQREQINKEYKELFTKISKEKNSQAIIDQIEKAVPEEFFPPCIKKGLKGISDGKKRFMFLLMNFLTSVGWDYDSIEKLLKEWNKKNPEQLREVLIEGHLRYFKQNNKKVLPPNCDNKAYYADIGLCIPDEFCKYIKNPAQYAKKKTRYSQQNNKPKKEAKPEKEKKEAKEKIPKEKKVKEKKEEKEINENKIKTITAIKEETK